MRTAIRLPFRPLRAALLLMGLPLLATAGSAPESVQSVSARFSGPDIPLRRDLDLQLVTHVPGSPTAITHAGDDRLFVTLRDGRILIVRNGSFVAQPFLDIRGQVSTGGEGGLLSTAFHPRYAQNGFFFINYTNAAGDTVIARYRVSGDRDRADPASRRVLLTIGQPFANHNGGQLQFGPGGYLYIGMGDGGGAFDSQCNAQRDDTLLGKMLRLDVDQNVNAAPFYGIPADNPFRGPGGMPDEVWAVGLRNPWRFSFDRQTGDLWIADVGQNAREEVNLEPAGTPGGRNYGWRVMEGTLCVGRGSCPSSVPPCDSAAFTLPFIEYDHSAGNCSVTGGSVYRGGAVAHLRGTYLFGDFCTGTLWTHRRISATAFEIFHLEDRLPQLVTFGEDLQGEIYVASLAGQIYRITGEAAPPPPPPPPATEGVAVYEPATARFHLKHLLATGPADQVVRFGTPGSPWLPITGDWNGFVGNGPDTIGLYDAAKGLFRLKSSLTSGNADVLLRLRLPSRRKGLPVAGDWDGDGRDTVGLFDTFSTFYLKDSLSGSGFDAVCGFDLRFRPPAKYLPVVGDWDGDGRDTIGLYRPDTGTFLLANGCVDQTPEQEFHFGPARRSLPVAGDWDGDGRDGVGVYEPGKGIFRLKNELAAGNADHVFRLRPRIRNGAPLAGQWVLVPR